MTGAAGTPARPGGRLWRSTCTGCSVQASGRRCRASSSSGCIRALSVWARWRDRPMTPRALRKMRKTFLKPLCACLSVRPSRWRCLAGLARHARRLPWNGPVELWPARWCAPPMVRSAAAAGQVLGNLQDLLHQHRPVGATTAKALGHHAQQVGHRVPAGALAVLEGEIRPWPSSRASRAASSSSRLS